MNYIFKAPVVVADVLHHVDAAPTMQRSNIYNSCFPNKTKSLPFSVLVFILSFAMELPSDIFNI